MFSHSEDLLAGSSQQDRAGFRIFTLCDEGKILVTNLLHLKQSRPCADIFLTQLVRPADDASATRPEERQLKEMLCWLLSVR